MIGLQTIAVAFAMFSALPVPQFAWNQKNMRYAMCAFPLIGAVIGGLWCLCGALPLPMPAKAAGFCLIPVWVTGGIHLDGYADTCDALSSYGDREKKLEILKDPHCGAFAVIRLCSYFAAYLALCLALGNIKNRKKQYTIMIIGIILAMVFSSSIVFLYSAAQETSNANYYKSHGYETMIISAAGIDESDFKASAHVPSGQGGKSSGSHVLSGGRAAAGPLCAGTAGP